MEASIEYLYVKMQTIEANTGGLYDAAWRTQEAAQLYTQPSTDATAGKCNTTSMLGVSPEPF